jgi:hypothetical protein
MGKHALAILRCRFRAGGLQREAELTPTGRADRRRHPSSVASRAGTGSGKRDFSVIENETFW